MNSYFVDLFIEGGKKL